MLGRRKVTCFVYTNRLNHIRGQPHLAPRCAVLSRLLRRVFLVKPMLAPRFQKLSEKVS